MILQLEHLVSTLAIYWGYVNGITQSTVLSIGLRRLSSLAPAEHGPHRPLASRLYEDRLDLYRLSHCAVAQPPLSLAAKERTRGGRAHSVLLPRKDTRALG
jgi:hypothetical protein